MIPFVAQTPPLFTENKIMRIFALLVRKAVVGVLDV